MKNLKNLDRLQQLHNLILKENTGCKSSRLIKILLPKRVDNPRADSTGVSTATSYTLAASIFLI